LQKAEVVLSLDADPLGSGPAAVRMAADFAEARSPENGRMNRLWSVESSLSPTGIQADHRLAIRSAQVAAFVAALEAAISAGVGESPTQEKPAAAFLDDPKVAKFFDALVKDLIAAKGKSAVVVGDIQ